MRRCRLCPLTTVRGATTLGLIVGNVYDLDAPDPATPRRIGGGLVLLGLPLFLSRVIGWPLVLVIGAELAAAVAAVVARSRRRSPRNASQH
jgi:hypothetical protein